MSTKNTKHAVYQTYKIHILKQLSDNQKSHHFSNELATCASLVHLSKQTMHYILCTASYYANSQSAFSKCPVFHIASGKSNIQKLSSVHERLLCVAGSLRLEKMSYCRGHRSYSQSAMMPFDDKIVRSSLETVFHNHRYC